MVDESTCTLRLPPAALVGGSEGNPSAASSMPSTVDDIALMAEVARGDRAAQRVLVRRLLGRIERVCRALLRNRQDAEDAAQLSVLEVFKSARTYRGESSLERWSDRITARTALRAAASERRARQAPLGEERQFTHASAEHALLARQYLDGVSERQRAVLILRHGLEYSVEEIADICGISPNTVKDRLLRGRTSLRRLLRQDRIAEFRRAHRSGE
jgi:RNA polymerase sigma-70 factor (ECF subfamily)